MKNIIYKLFLVSTITFGIVSCDEFVDYEASETYNIVADDYFKSSNDYEAALVGVYDVTQINHEKATSLIYFLTSSAVIPIPWSII